MNFRFFFTAQKQELLFWYAEYSSFMIFNRLGFDDTNTTPEKQISLMIT